jgi:hypothetical protein
LNCRQEKEEENEMASGEQQEILALKPEVVVTVMEEGAVLLDLETKYFYSVNATGWAIVQMLESGATREQIQAQCGCWSKESAETSRVGTFIETLVREKLVVPGSNLASPDQVKFSGEWSSPAIEKHKEPLQRIMVSAFDPSIPLAE